MTHLLTDTERETLTKAIADHAFGETLGDNDLPKGKRFTCRCGWEHRVDGMSGWRSWLDRHAVHVAEEYETALALTYRAEAQSLDEQGGPDADM